jgi:hypothetical protein
VGACLRGVVNGTPANRPPPCRLRESSDGEPQWSAPSSRAHGLVDLGFLSPFSSPFLGRVPVQSPVSQTGPECSVNREPCTLMRVRAAFGAG